MACWQPSVLRAHLACQLLATTPASGTLPEHQVLARRLPAFGALTDVWVWMAERDDDPKWYPGIGVVSPFRATCSHSAYKQVCRFATHLNHVEERILQRKRVRLEVWSLMVASAFVCLSCEGQPQTGVGGLRHKSDTGQAG